MEETREDKILSDLFRNKLENAEVTPSPEAGAGIMRRTGRREFLRFNPARMNIWYVAAVAAVGTVLALILSSSPENEIKNPPESQPAEINIESGNVVISQTVPAIREKEINNTPEHTGKTAQTAASGKDNSMKTGVTGTAGPLNKETADIQKVNALPGTKVLPAALSENNQLKNNRTGSLIKASALSGCLPLKVSFMQSSQCDSCRWSFGDGGFSSRKNPDWIFDTAGEFRVSLTVFSEGKGIQSSIVINVHPKPIARFDINPENAVIPGDEITFRNYSEGAEKYMWYFGDGSGSENYEPHHEYKKYGNYSVTLVAISEYGCCDSLILKNAFPRSGYFIEFPNALIPNENGPSGGYYSQTSDEASQIFHPSYSGVTEYQLRIFSKRGILIFESNDISYGWDGYYKGQLCEPGVYIWKVRGNFMNGEQFIKMGDLTLLKK